MVKSDEDGSDYFKWENNNKNTRETIQKINRPFIISPTKTTKETGACDIKNKINTKKYVLSQVMFVVLIVNVLLSRVLY